MTREVLCPARAGIPHPHHVTLGRKEDRKLILYVFKDELYTLCLSKTQSEKKCTEDKEMSNKD